MTNPKYFVPATIDYDQVDPEELEKQRRNSLHSAKQKTFKRYRLHSATNPNNTYLNNDNTMVCLDDQESESFVHSAKNSRQTSKTGIKSNYSRRHQTIQQPDIPEVIFQVKSQIKLHAVNKKRVHRNMSFQTDGAKPMPPRIIRIKKKQNFEQKPKK